MTLKRSDLLHGVSFKVPKYDRQSESVLILVNHSLDWLSSFDSLNIKMIT